jgi:hypothetical protein
MRCLSIQVSLEAEIGMPLARGEPTGQTEYQVIFVAFASADSVPKEREKLRVMIACVRQRAELTPLETG